MPPIINSKKCTGCMLCYENCPLDVFGFDHDEKKSVVLYPDECWHCGACELDCPAGAIDVRLPVPVASVLKRTVKI